MTSTAGAAGAAGASGAAGAAGTAGAPGTDGAQGAAGPSGVAGAHLVYGTGAVVEPKQFGTSTATCPVGELVLGGGHTTADGVPWINVWRSYIADEGRSYIADGINESGPDARYFNAYAICA